MAGDTFMTLSARISPRAPRAVGDVVDCDNCAQGAVTWHGQHGHFELSPRAAPAKSMARDNSALTSLNFCLQPAKAAISLAMNPEKLSLRGHTYFASSWYPTLYHIGAWFGNAVFRKFNLPRARVSKGVGNWRAQGPHHVPNKRRLRFALVHARRFGPQWLVAVAGPHMLCNRRAAGSHNPAVLQAPRSQPPTSNKTPQSPYWR